MSKEVDHAADDVNVGINLGMAMEMALQEANVSLEEAPAEQQAPQEQPVVIPENPAVIEQQSQEILTGIMTSVAADMAVERKHPVPPDARIVAVEFPVGEHAVPRGNITVLPYDGYRGRIVIGPPHGLSGRIAANKFAEQLNVVDLEFARFEFAHNSHLDTRTRKVIKEGTIKKQGSLVNNAPGVWECQACGHIFNTYPKLENSIRKINGGKRNQCNQPECVSARQAKGEEPARLMWRRTPSPQLSPNDALVDRLYKAFCTENPVLDEMALIPRVWGIYPANAAPTDWVPAQDDWKAQLIDTRSQQKSGYTIRPYSVTKLVQQTMLQQGGVNTCKGLIVEVSIDRSGVHGPVIGWLRPAMLNMYPESPDNVFGYTIRFCGHKHHSNFTGHKNSNNLAV